MLLKVLWSPREAMFLVSKDPRPLMPLALLCVFTFLTQNVILANVDSSQLSLTTELVMLAALLADPIARIALISLLYFGLFTLLGRTSGFKTFFAVTSFAFVPLVFRFLATIVLAFRDPQSALIGDVAGSIGPAMFLHRDTTSPYLFTAVNAIDLVNIWILALLTIGYGFLVRPKSSKPMQIVAVVGVFLIYVGVRLAVIAAVSR